MKKLISLFTSLTLVGLIALPTAYAADNATALVTATVTGAISLTTNAPSPLILSAGGTPVETITTNGVIVTVPSSTAYTVKVHAIGPASDAAIASQATPADKISAGTWDAIAALTSSWGLKVSSGVTPGAGTVGIGDTAVTASDLTFFSSTGTGTAQNINVSYKAAAASGQALHPDYKTTVFYTAFPS